MSSDMHDVTSSERQIPEGGPEAVAKETVHLGRKITTSPDEQALSIDKTVQNVLGSTEELGTGAPISEHVPQVLGSTEDLPATSQVALIRKASEGVLGSTEDLTATHPQTIALQKSEEGHQKAAGLAPGRDEMDALVNVMNEASTKELFESSATNALTHAIKFDFQSEVESILQAAEPVLDTDKTFNLALIASGVESDSPAAHHALVAYFRHQINVTLTAKDPAKQLVSQLTEKMDNKAFYEAFSGILRESDPTNSAFYQACLTQVIKGLFAFATIFEFVVIFAIKSNNSDVIQALFSAYPSNEALVKSLVNADQKLIDNPIVKEAFLKVFDDVIQERNIHTTSTLYKNSRENDFVKEVLGRLLDQYSKLERTDDINFIRSCVRNTHVDAIASSLLEDNISKLLSALLGCITADLAPEILENKWIVDEICTEVNRQPQNQVDSFRKFVAETPELRPVFEEFEKLDAEKSKIVALLSQNEFQKIVDYLKDCSPGAFERTLKIIDTQSPETRETIAALLESNNLAVRPRLSAYLRDLREAIVHDPKAINTHAKLWLLTEIEQTLCNKGSMVDIVIQGGEFPLLKELLTKSDAECCEILAEFNTQQRRALEIEIIRYRDSLLQSIHASGSVYRDAGPDSAEKDRARQNFVDDLVMILPIYPSALISIMDLPGFDETVKQKLVERRGLYSPFPELRIAFQKAGWA